MNDLTEKLLNVKDKFFNDPEVMSLIAQLNFKIGEISEQEFTDDEIASEEFIGMNAGFYEHLKDSSLDEISVFDILWLATWLEL